MTTPDWINLRDGVVDRTCASGPFPSDGRYVRVGALPSNPKVPYKIMTGTMREADFGANTITLDMDPDYFAAAGRFALIAIGDKP